ncbi:MAG: translation elongation factor Ts [Anaerolineae bacterium]|nr:translation elongation factor Ts [Anaerolineae bacterium]NUQ04517.1 translation elongation factor Ts [Anaerolineae bacterium]
MAITAQQIKELREATGAGPLDCKKALEATEGDFNKAVNFLREKGLAKAAKKLGAGRTMNEGVIEVYQHFNRRVAVIVEVNCETDFVANTAKFRAFAKDLALHIANLAPEYIKREDVPAAVVEAERTVQLHRYEEENAGKKEKPADVVEKIVGGRMDKFFEELVLMEQPFLKDDTKTVRQLFNELVAEVGESCEIRRFARFALGETVEQSEEA